MFFLYLLCLVIWFSNFPKDFLAWGGAGLCERAVFKSHPPIFLWASCTVSSGAWHTVLVSAGSSVSRHLAKLPGMGAGEASGRATHHYRNQ